MSSTATDGPVGSTVGPSLSPPGLPGQVFLSYASQDAQAAQRICEALRAAGIEVWFDQSDQAGRCRSVTTAAIVTRIAALERQEGRTGFRSAGALEG